MPQYIPSEQHIDRMPVDISFVFESERPAGKHGFCQRVGDRFVFEDGTPAKFFGVICNGVSYGRLPILTEVIDAEIELKTSCPDLQVWAINSEGSYSGVVKSVWENGILKFHVGPHWPSQYYLIMQE